MTRQNETAHRQAWMRLYRDTLQSELPAAARRICWDTAVVFYNQGLAAEEAARQQAGALREQWMNAPLNTF